MDYCESQKEDKAKEEIKKILDSYNQQMEGEESERGGKKNEEKIQDYEEKVEKLRQG